MSTDDCIPTFDNLLAIFYSVTSFWHQYGFHFLGLLGSTKTRFTSIHIIGHAPLLDQLRVGVFKSKVVDFCAGSGFTLASSVGDIHTVWPFLLHIELRNII